MVNINPGNNEELVNNCRTLQEYVLYIEKVRKYAADMPIEQAVERAVDECIEAGILAEFLRQNKAEAIAMSIFEYNQEAHMKCVRQEGFEDGRAEGKAEDILELLEEELGDIPKELYERIYAEKDLQQLKKWLKLAAKAETVEQFMEEM